MIFDGVMLPFIDYTNEFKNAMRNWPLPKFDSSERREALEEVKLAEDLIKDKLRLLDKVWAICVECDEHKRNDYKSYNTYLHLRVGPINIHEPFYSLTNMLKFSEWIYIDYTDTEGNEEHTDLTLKFPLEYPITKRVNTVAVQIRIAKTRPLKLREFFEKKYNKEF